MSTTGRLLLFMEKAALRDDLIESFAKCASMDDCNKLMALMMVADCMWFLEDPQAEAYKREAMIFATQLNMSTIGKGVSNANPTNPGMGRG